MSNLPIFAALIGVTALIFAILRDTLFEPTSILLSILGIIVGSLITYLVVGDCK